MAVDAAVAAGAADVAEPVGHAAAEEGLLSRPVGMSEPEPWLVVYLSATGTTCRLAANDR